MTSYILGIHTSTPTLALGLLDLNRWDIEQGKSCGNLIQARRWRLDRQMSSQLHPCLEEFFPAERWQTLVAVAVAIGPGSFTSCRMGVTVARTLGQGLDIPLFGLSSLAAIAEDYIDAAKRHQETEDSMAVAVRMDAKRGEWFGGIYEEAENGVAATIGDRLWTDDEWQVASEGIITVEAGDWETHPPVAALLKLAAKRYGSGQRPQWSTILPFYGRKPPIHNG